jgi:hypothetical protein
MLDLWSGHLAKPRIERVAEFDPLAVAVQYVRTREMLASFVEIAEKLQTAFVDSIVLAAFILALQAGDRLAKELGDRLLLRNYRALNRAAIDACYLTGRGHSRAGRRMLTRRQDGRRMDTARVAPVPSSARFH